MKSDDLHVRMTHGAAGKVTVVFKKNNGFVCAARLQTLPVADTEAQQPRHVANGVIGHVNPARRRLDENELVGVLENIVFIAQKDKFILRVNDIGQSFWMAEGTIVFLVNNIFRFLMS